jgi:hypothetical protein
MPGTFDSFIAGKEARRAEIKERIRINNIVALVERHMKFDEKVGDVESRIGRYASVAARLQSIWDRAGGALAVANNERTPMIGVRVAPRNPGERMEGILLDARLNRGHIFRMTAIRYEEITEREHRRSLRFLKKDGKTPNLQVLYGDGQATYGFRVPHLEGGGKSDEVLIRGVESDLLRPINLGEYDSNAQIRYDLRIRREQLGLAIGRFAEPIIAQLEDGLERFPVDASADVRTS